MLSLTIISVMKHSTRFVYVALAIVCLLPTPATTFLPLTLPTTTTTTAAVTVSTGLATAAVNEPADAIIAPDVMDQCPMGYFHCNISAQCVPQRLNCDDKADCDDASDEWNCVNDVDAKFWDHFFRKQPYGRHDDVPVETCYWLNSTNFSCLCRGDEILCRFQQLTAMPANLPATELAMLDLTGNNFPNIDENFFAQLPVVESLVLKFCSIEQLAPYAFRRLSEIPLKTLYLDENKITSLSENLFSAENSLITLILSGNRIKELHNYDFQHLERLTELDLRGNRIETFEADVFGMLQSLEVLYLNENHIHQIRPGMFPVLTKLHTLSLAHNRIADIERNSFTFPRLLHLFLAGNRLSVLRARTFCPLRLLQGLHLNDNRLAQFELHAFDCMQNLTSLLLTGNEFKTLDPRVLQNLSSLNYIYFSWFHLCRAALHVRVCEPRGDGISSTYHLLDNQILRGSVWVMAFVATVGNLLVLLGRYFYKSRSNVEHSLYLRHLAASDFLMGIYLTIIACADIRFRGKYIYYDELWRQSVWCDFSGFLSTFSCQSSTLLLTLVTWDRLMSVTRPLKPRDSGKTRIVFRLGLLWGMSFVLAALPFLPIKYFGGHFYGTNGVCLSLHIHDPFAKGWEYSALLFILINTVSLIFISNSYIRMLQAIRDSGGGMRSTLSGRENVVATRFAIIVTTDCACWLPIIVVKVAALSGCAISPSLYAWLAVLVLPVNSALNPVLYTLTTAAFKQQLLRYCQAVPTSCSLMTDPRSQTQTAFDSNLSMSLGHFSSIRTNHSHNYSRSSSRKRSQNRRLSYV
ncbi:relaxin receptor 2 [Bactrocera tryoni]|uniref:relaxin receptor 2 n=1 Tax=Bactrocera tryoni TaxID=59916 RepID=UPI001A995040|nr:relaxin receptor 2 [Bactrocera tryoni]XP_039961843.1 relaxin receptor 2 [Bactrocera tryoni]XP_039961844.1 relaxin receptor 2 [Bactrocera tryoni]